MSNQILVDARGAADLLCVSERKFHQLRAHPLFPADTEARLSERAVRFRVERLQEFAENLARESAPLVEPEHLRRARQQLAEKQAS